MNRFTPVVASLLLLGAYPLALPAGSDSIPSAATKTARGHWALVSVAVQSSKKGLGNVADPSMVQLPNGAIRLYFKNGNEPQSGIKGHDNLVHSVISRNNGKTWKIESGARNTKWTSPIEVLPDSSGFRAFGWILSPSGDQLTTSTSANGLKFPAPGKNTKLRISACKTPKGRAKILGDPSIAQLPNGSWVAVVQVSKTTKSDGGGKHLGYGCVYLSSSLTSWSKAKVSYFGTSPGKGKKQEVVTNPMVYRSGSIVERWTPGMDTVLFETSKNGKVWRGSSHFLPAADPERLNLKNGTKLLAFGNFDGRYGGAIIVAKKVISRYKFVRQKLGDSLTIRITGTKRTKDAKVWNLCANKPASKIGSAKVKVTRTSGGLKVTIRDSGKPKGLVLNCYYVLVGSLKILG